jgi:hypothetical protein
MSKEELDKLYDAAMAKQTVSTEEGVKAAKIIFEQAENEEIECALAGGIAMHIFGYQRATHDVDLLASKELNRPSEQKLSFGGETYSVQVGERNITVDVIVRDDFFRSFYEAALRDAGTTRDGLRIITPEWMVILKFLARRGKDILDLLWLLKKPGLVDRDKVTRLLEQVAGETGAQIALAGLETYYVQADVMRSGDENGKQE